MGHKHPAVLRDYFWKFNDLSSQVPIKSTAAARVQGRQLLKTIRPEILRKMFAFSSAKDFEEPGESSIAQ